MEKARWMPRSVFQPRAKVRSKARWEAKSIVVSLHV
jgi:hypothetical protein